MNLWPTYHDEIEFETDYLYQANVSLEGLELLQGYFNEFQTDETT